MQVVILAGGLGSRLRAVASDVPKALMCVAGKPFIQRQFDLLLRNGLRNVLLCVGYKAGLIEEHVGDGTRFGLSVRYSREDPASLLGTGGALVNALPLLEDSFLVMYGDSYLPTDYVAVARAFRTERAEALMCVYRNENMWERSNVCVSGKRVSFYSKTDLSRKTDHIDYGLSAFGRAVIEEYRNTRLPLDLSRIQEDLVARGQMAALVVKERFYQIGTPQGLAELESLIKGVHPPLSRK